jgi:hypothetical protein
MNITLSPQRSDNILIVSKSGDALTINDVVYDFSVIPDGASLPASAVGCPFIVGDIERISGVLHLTMIAPHGANPSNAAAFPSPLINPVDGVLELPQ